MKAKITVCTLLFLLCSVLPSKAQNDPYDGYTNPNSYFLDYSENTSFAPGNSGDVTVNFSIPESSATNFTMNVDTGSRGVLISEEDLGTNFTTNSSTTSGQETLDSSGRVYSGFWTPVTFDFDVTPSSNANTNTMVSSAASALDVQALSAEANRTATFDIRSDQPANGTVNIIESDGVTTNTLAYTDRTVTLTNGQSMSYAMNPGKLGDISNFGIGPGHGGMTNDTNQIYNPLLNLTPMNNGAMVPGYVIMTNGIQLGLSTNNVGYAYTKLSPTGLISGPSTSYWQVATGQTVVHGITNAPGSVIMDSGIGNAFISSTNLNTGDIINSDISVQLLNSGVKVGYTITPSTTNDLNPTYTEVVAAPTNGTFTQDLPPFQDQQFNTGRNVFEAFNMLYDAQNGYLGLLTNDYGATNSNVFFTGGYYPNPVPEPNSGILVVISLLLMGAGIKLSKRV